MLITWHIFPVSLIFPNSDRTPLCFHRPTHSTETTLGVLLILNLLTRVNPGCFPSNEWKLATSAEDWTRKHRHVLRIAIKEVKEMALAVCWVLACVAGGFFGVLFSFVVKGKSLIRPFSPLLLPDSVLLNLPLLVISSQKVGFMINKWQFWETKLAKRANYASSAFLEKRLKLCS